jgi:hypothetical protein
MDGRTTAAVPEWRRSMLKEAIHGDYLRYAEGQRIMRRVSPEALGRFLRRMLRSLGTKDPWPHTAQRVTNVERPDGQGGIEVRRERQYFYDLPSLEECRRAWEDRFGPGWDWPSEESEQQQRGRAANGEHDDPY